MRSRIRAAFGRSLAAIAVGAVAATACQTAPRTAPEPVATSLVVRNSSAFDVNLYTLPAASAKPIWLGTIGAAKTGSFPVPARALGSGSTLVVQTAAVGATSTWTSEPVPVIGGRVPLLDIVVSGTGNCTGSALYSVTTIDLDEFMR